MTLLRSLSTVLCTAVLVACSPSTGPSKGKPNQGHGGLPDMTAGVGGGGGGSGGSGGGGGKPGVCGGGTTGGGCTGPLCPATCPAGTSTKISGYVYAPTDPAKWGAADPLPNALVFIPTKPLDPLPQGASCTQCNGQASGPPIVSATTDTHG